MEIKGLTDEELKVKARKYLEAGSELFKRERELAAALEEPVGEDQRSETFVSYLKAHAEAKDTIEKAIALHNEQLRRWNEFVKEQAISFDTAFSVQIKRKVKH